MIASKMRKMALMMEFMLRIYMGVESSIAYITDIPKFKIIRLMPNTLRRNLRSLRCFLASSYASSSIIHNNNKLYLCENTNER